MKLKVSVVCMLLLACSSNNSKPEPGSSNDLATNTNQLEGTSQNLELSYIAWACDCANWATEADIRSTGENQDSLSHKSVFIEPADSSLALPDTLGFSGDLIRFTGQFYKEKGYPKKYPLTEMKVEKAKVFRYTGYTVLRSNYKSFVSGMQQQSKHAKRRPTGRY